LNHIFAGLRHKLAATGLKQAPIRSATRWWMGRHSNLAFVCGGVEPLYCLANGRRRLCALGLGGAEG
jgi:hypothetical protein